MEWDRNAARRPLARMFTVAEVDMQRRRGTRGAGIDHPQRKDALGRKNVGRTRNEGRQPRAAAAPPACQPTRKE
jgi:hypothetical protein